MSKYIAAARVPPSARNSSARVGLHLGAIAATLLLTGCASPMPDRASRMQRGYIYYLDGAGGGKPLHNWSSGVREGFRAAGYTGAGEMFSWETGLGVTADQVASVEYKRGKATELATKIADFQRQQPQAPITLIGLSAGTAMAVFTLELLPPETAVETVILLSGSLSADYDLTSALRHVRGRVYVFTSHRDGVLQYLMPIAGAADRADASHGAIGVDGVRLPRTTSTDTRQLYRKVVTVPWKEEFARLGNAGGHTDTVKAPFVQAVVAPLVVTRAVPIAAAAAQDLVANPDYQRWASFAPGSWTEWRGYQVVAGIRTPLAIRATLVECNEHRLVVEREFRTEGGVSVNTPLSRRFVVAAQIDPCEHPATAPQRHQRDLPPETLTVGGQALTCEGRQIQAAGEFPEWGSDIDAILYSSTDIPGGSARLDVSLTLSGKPARFVGQVVEMHIARR